MRRNCSGTRLPATLQVAKHRVVCESLEARLFLSVSNAIDEIDFGNAGSEAAHAFDTGVTTLPPSGTGALGLTYREIAGPASGTGVGSNNEVLTFTMTVDPFAQNYITIKLWGSDTTPGVIYLYDPTKGYSVDNYDESPTTWLDWQVSGGQPAFPGRFYYDTVPIPLAWTQGKTSISLTLNAAENDERYDNHTTVQLTTGQTMCPIYSGVYHHQPGFYSSEHQRHRLGACGDVPNAQHDYLFAGVVSSAIDVEQHLFRIEFIFQLRHRAANSTRDRGRSGRGHWTGFCSPTKRPGFRQPTPPRNGMLRSPRSLRDRGIRRFPMSF